MLKLRRLLFAALSLLALPAALAGGPAMQVRDAWARATPPGVSNGAVYLTLVNRGAMEDRLLRVETDIASAAEMHEHRIDNGVARMRPVASIAIAPGGQTELLPGGLHLMLIGLQKPLAEGESLTLTLHFARAGVLKWPVSVGRSEHAHH